MTTCMFREDGARCEMEADIALWSSTYRQLVWLCLLHFGYIMALLTHRIEATP